MIGNYSQLVERISKSSGLSIEDIERRIEAKRAKLSGLISKEGAAQVIAAELGISFDKEKMKISELLDGMKKVNVIGKIIQLSSVIEYNKNGRQGKVVNFVLADETNNVRTVLWDTNHISLIEKKSIKEGDVVEITNAGVRNKELHLTGFSDIKLSNEVLEKVIEEQSFAEKNIIELKPGESGRLRAVVVQVFEPKFFTTCPECRKKVSETGECAEHGKVAGQRRALLSIVLDDGTETMRSVMFSEQIEKIAKAEDLEPGNFEKKKAELLGKEMLFSGQARQNKMFNNTEFFIQDLQDIDIDKLIAELER